MWLRKSFGRTACYTGSQILAKDMSTELSDVMDSVVKVVNIVKKSALQTRLFSNLCAADGEEHTGLLYHSEVRWLSRGTVLSRVLELRTSIRDFLLLFYFSFR